MTYYEYIFVVCTYGSASDLAGFIDSVKGLCLPAKIIVANSYYDDATRDRIRDISDSNGCVFLDLKNNGYGHSLNDGIDYARANFGFKYLIISNADIIIKRLDMRGAPKGRFVLAPEIITRTGKRQNPFYIFPHFKLFKFSKWYGRTFHIKRNFTVIIIAKLERVIFNLVFGRRRGFRKKIFAAHGSHILFSREALDELGRPFEDDIFLYCEENFLGYKLRQHKIPLYYTCDISVIHEEDGSKDFYGHVIGEEIKKSMAKYHKLIKDD